MTCEHVFPDCPECNGAGRWASTSASGEPEEIYCDRCGGTGVIDPADRPDMSEPMGGGDGL